MVAVGRSSLSLWFTEPVNEAASTFTVRGVDGSLVATRFTTESGGAIVRVTTPSLARATYVLTWKALALEDGHASHGSILFGVGTRPDVVPATGDALPGSATVVVRWVDLLAILLSVGALAVGGRVIGSLGARAPHLRRRAAVMGAVAATGAFLSGWVTPFVRTQVDGLTGDAWAGAVGQLLTDSPWGPLWLARQAFLVVAAVALWWWVSRSGPALAARRTALVGLVAVAGLEAWAGHASGLTSGSVVTGLAATVHVLAAGVWAGGLLLLTLLLLPPRVAPLGEPTDAAAWRAYSPRAASAALLLVATGLLETGRNVPTTGALTATVYGDGVLLKVGLVALALALAAVNTLGVNERLSAGACRVLRRPSGWTPTPGRFARLVVCEVLVLLAALGGAALITSVPAARETAAATAPTAPHTSTVDGLFVTFESVGSGPDRSRVIVRARSTLKPAAAPITGASVQWVGPDAVPTFLSLSTVEPGRFEAETARPGPGMWTARIAIHRPGRPDAVTTQTWAVVDAAARPAGALEAVTTIAAVVLLLLGLVVTGVVRARTHPRPRVVPGRRARTGSSDPASPQACPPLPADPPTVRSLLAGPGTAPGPSSTSDDESRVGAR
jgi:copper transport protein